MNKDEKMFIRSVAEWDTTNWYRGIAFWEKFNKDYKNKKILTIGEKNGGLTLYFAKKGCYVTCTDLNGINEKAMEIHKLYNLEEWIEYKNADITNLEFENESFDIVAFKSVLGALRSFEKQKVALNEIKRVLKRDGCLLFVENMEATKTHMYLRKKFIAWSSYWKYLNYNEMGDLFNNYCECKFFYLGFLGTLGRNQMQRKIFGSIDKYIEWVLPDKNKYIVSGFCKVDK